MIMGGKGDTALRRMIKCVKNTLNLKE